MQATPPAAEKHRTVSAARRVLVVGRGSEAMHEEVRAHGFEVVANPAHADFVLSYGGDGSLLGADRDYPNLPKLPLRRDSQYIKCPRHTKDAVLERVFAGNQAVSLLTRISAEARGRKILAINDIVFHNARAVSAVRYRLIIDGLPYSGEVVGDGVVLATPFGSSAYYRSITNSIFRVGIGLAFNNSTEATNHLVLAESSVVEIHVTRGPAIVVGDNIEDPLPVEAGDVIRVSFTSQRAMIWELETLLCKECLESDTRRPAGWRHV